MRVNKYNYIWVIQQYTESHEWEDVNAEETPEDARRSLREYRENQPEYPCRKILRREPNPEYKKEEV